jgi:uncharacterized protein involved in exopolysaccharide biosynthesis
MTSMPHSVQLYTPPETSDTIDVADVVRTMRRQWRAVIGFLALGVIGAAAVVLFAPRRFDGKASVLVRSATPGGASVVGRLTGIGELMGGLASGALGSGVETELQVLRSRALAGQVVDSLRLQFRVRQPARTPPVAMIESASLEPSFAPRKYSFERTPAGTYRTTQGDKTYELTPGKPGALDIGSVTLRTGNLPASFVLGVEDQEDAILRFTKRLDATKAGGEVVKIVYRGDDSLSAALGPNALIGFYLERRRTTDRGVNQRKVELVTAQLDSTSTELAATEAALRRYQESSGVLDAEISAKVEVQAFAEQRRALTDAQIEEGALKQLLAQSELGHLTSRDLAAYPTFLRGSSISPLVGQLTDLEAQRIRLLERRTERDPEVIALDQSMRAIEASILATVKSYASSVTRQRVELKQRLDSMQRTLLALPAAAEHGGRLQRDVERLTKIFTALQANLVEARLAAIGEGGDLRPLDIATPPRRPSFPEPFLTMGIGTAGGLVVGMIAALFLGWFGRWLRDPLEIERAVGVTAQRFLPNAPLLMAGTGARTVLIVPLDHRAQSGGVAERLALTAKQRSHTATVLDLSASYGSGNGNGTGDAPAAVIDRLEQQGEGMIIVRLPGLASDTTMAALNEHRSVLFVAPPGPVDRVRLANAVNTLRQLQVPCAGVVISESAAPRALL